MGRTVWLLNLSLGIMDEHSWLSVMLRIPDKYLASLGEQRGPLNGGSRGPGQALRRGECSLPRCELSNWTLSHPLLLCPAGVLKQK